MIQLLDPPFDHANSNPGYIKGYVPGVRENGGQYTHAAIWVVMAFAQLGDRKRTAELLHLLNPIHHGSTPEQISVYKVEPYVIAADVYGLFPHDGRGGWTWYTGSAGWMYQLILESVLGLKREGNRLRVVPVVPEGWSSFSVHYVYGGSTYHIHVMQQALAETVINVDGIEQAENFITLLEDGKEHTVEILAGLQGGAPQNSWSPARRKQTKPL